MYGCCLKRKIGRLSKSQGASKILLWFTFQCVWIYDSKISMRWINPPKWNTMFLFSYWICIGTYSMYMLSISQKTILLKPESHQPLLWILLEISSNKRSYKFQLIMLFLNENTLIKHVMYNLLVTLLEMIICIGLTL